MTNKNLLIGIFVMVIAVGVLLLNFWLPVDKKIQTPSNSPLAEKPLVDNLADNSIKQSSLLAEPISQVLQRITKKPFGIKISPQDSPVTPERFSGYHTGVDFEILSGEENLDITVYAICEGEILLKRWVAGYGGALVQSCNLEGEDITVLYGHLNLSSVELNVRQKLLQGAKIGILGQAYTSETDKERKHLHLGIHKGTKVDLRGYVATSGELDNWIDITSYLIKE